MDNLREEDARRDRRDRVRSSKPRSRHGYASMPDESRRDDNRRKSSHHHQHAKRSSSALKDPDVSKTKGNTSQSRLSQDKLPPPPPYSKRPGDDSISAVAPQPDVPPPANTTKPGGNSLSSTDLQEGIVPPAKSTRPGVTPLPRPDSYVGVAPPAKANRPGETLLPHPDSEVGVAPPAKSNRPGEITFSRPDSQAVVTPPAKSNRPGEMSLPRPDSQAVVAPPAKSNRPGEMPLPRPDSQAVVAPPAKANRPGEAPLLRLVPRESISPPAKPTKSGEASLSHSYPEPVISPPAKSTRPGEAPLPYDGIDPNCNVRQGLSVIDEHVHSGSAILETDDGVNSNLIVHTTAQTMTSVSASQYHPSSLSRSPWPKGLYSTNKKVLSIEHPIEDSINIQSIHSIPNAEKDVSKDVSKDIPPVVTGYSNIASGEMEDDDGMPVATNPYPTAERPPAISSTLGLGIFTSLEKRLSVGSTYTFRFANKGEFPDSTAVGEICVYPRLFTLGLRFPLPPEMCELLSYYQFPLYQWHPNSIRYFIAYVVVCRLHDIPFSVKIFAKFFSLRMSSDGFVNLFAARQMGKLFVGLSEANSDKGWKQKYFFMSPAAGESFPFPTSWRVHYSQDDVPRCLSFTLAEKDAFKHVRQLTRTHPEWFLISNLLNDESIKSAKLWPAGTCTSVSVATLRDDMMKFAASKGKKRKSRRPSLGENTTDLQYSVENEDADVGIRPSSPLENLAGTDAKKRCRRPSRPRLPGHEIVPGLRVPWSKETQEDAIEGRVLPTIDDFDGKSQLEEAIRLPLRGSVFDTVGMARDICDRVLLPRDVAGCLQQLPTSLLTGGIVNIVQGLVQIVCAEPALLVAEDNKIAAESAKIELPLIQQRLEDALFTSSNKDKFCKEISAEAASYKAELEATQIQLIKAQEEVVAVHEELSSMKDQIADLENHSSLRDELEATKLQLVKSEKRADQTKNRLDDTEKYLAEMKKSRDEWMRKAMPGSESFMHTLESFRRSHNGMEYFLQHFNAGYSACAKEIRKIIPDFNLSSLKMYDDVADLLIEEDGEDVDDIESDGFPSSDGNMESADEDYISEDEDIPAAECLEKISSPSVAVESSKPSSSGIHKKQKSKLK